MTTIRRHLLDAIADTLEGLGVEEVVPPHGVGAMCVTDEVRKEFAKIVNEIRELPCDAS